MVVMVQELYRNSWWKWIKTIQTNSCEALLLILDHQLQTKERSCGGAGGMEPYSPSTANDGGSGGASYSSGTDKIGLGNTPSTSPIQGRNSGQGSDGSAGGGGGAGAVGGDAPSSIGGVGGAGVQVAILVTATTLLV